MTKEQRTKVIGLVSCVLAIAIAWVLYSRSAEVDREAQEREKAAVEVEQEQTIDPGGFAIARASWGPPVKEVPIPPLEGVTGAQRDRDAKLGEMAERLQGLEVFVREGRRKESK